jgi:hypothetical protein
MGFNHYGIFQRALFGWNLFAKVYEGFYISLDGLFGHLDCILHRFSKSVTTRKGGNRYDINAFFWVFLKQDTVFQGCHPSVIVGSGISRSLEFDLSGIFKIEERVGMGADAFRVHINIGSESRTSWHSRLCVGHQDFSSMKVSSNAYVKRL